MVDGADWTRAEWSRNQNHAEKIVNFKARVNELINELHSYEGCREYSLAMTKLEEAAMWAVKGMTR